MRQGERYARYRIECRTDGEDVRLAVNGKVKVEHFGRLGGIVPDPDEIVDALKEKLIKK